MHLLLSGIVGSVAYGLAGPGSDVDRIGVFAAPTVAFHGLHPPRESVVTTDPDVTLHEARKYALLALSGNPTATELMWLPDDCYETRTEFGERLIAIRSAFLSAPRVRDAYLGYATQQFRKLTTRDSSTGGRRRSAKHARHLARLLHQGRVLYATGVLEIRLADPEWFRAFGERVAGGALDEAEALVAAAGRDFDRIRTPLPDGPDEETVERWLLDVRAAHLPG
ncbi:MULTISPECIES: DNA polymerase beta superfamily protein [Micromonospora]|uniref:Nucleotidyltransferase n=1 Tax=Micromonospora solifontis TaxID=2487138 RepID=A0ABX9WL36_9ACTN|nr:MULTISPECIES: nucleotidyltransferase domain-containing protein [Micromonospora]NES15659.1 nucleotidyltransferase [Micromonospora sp. PPF5-17B]NES35959.1 nucleotidyltransferase [Micromonospora solifontis]NES56968.1 nucleotidyltransferase [Micromonospora sp. PPF5-6]RNM00067.1 nucleotidyltransferase [Micromonospora solifontis]